jgi:hypothetical protein
MVLNNNTYLLYEQTANFSAASVMCSSVGGNLASVHSTLESQLLLDLCAASPAGSCWLGLTSTTSDNGTNTWLDGSIIDWLPTYNFTLDTGCVHVNHVPASNTSATGPWQTSDCSGQLAFLCKVDSTAASHLDLYSISPSPAPYTTPNFTTPINSMVLNNNTYLLYEQTTNFSAASVMCSSVGGSLASVHSTLESQLLLDLCRYAATPNCWLGLAGHPNGNHSWVDGTPLNFLAWQDTNPVPGQDCSYVAAGQSVNSSGSSTQAWRSSGCGERLAFLCRVDSTAASQLNLYGISPSPSPAVPPSSPGPILPTTNMVLNNNTYVLYEQPANFTAATSMCQLLGGHLASAHSALESQLLSHLCAASPAGSCWLGLAQDSTSNGTYSWVDGSSLDWLPADTLNATGPCVHVQLSATNWSMPWQGGSCNTQRGFLCRVDSTAAAQLNLYGISPSPGPNPSPTPGLINPSNSMVLNNNTYLLYEQTANFSAANATCSSMGGSLASVHSTLESQLLLDLCRCATNSNCWLGLTNYPDGNHSWADSSPVDFFAWQAAYPVPGEECSYVAAGQSGSSSNSSIQAWRTSGCGEQLAFLCKVNSAAASQLNLYCIPPSPSVSPYPNPTPSSPTPGSPPQASFTMVLNNNTYLLYEQTANFSAAEQQCAAVGGQLASAHSPLENQVLLELCRQAAFGDCWFGLLPSGNNDSSYSWKDGSSTDFVAWRPNYPGEYSPGTCGYVAAKTPGSNSTALWQLAMCDYPLAFLCMVDSSASPELNLQGDVAAAVTVKVLNKSCTSLSQAGKQALLMYASICRQLCVQPCMTR